jgi:RNA 3'-terminal phosphate cyclase-like protein
VQQGGCIDSTHQAMALLFMTLCPEDVSKVRLGKLSPFTFVFSEKNFSTPFNAFTRCMFRIEFFRHLKDFFGIVFKLKADSETQCVVASCMGVGFKNLSKATC